MHTGQGRQRPTYQLVSDWTAIFVSVSSPVSSLTQRTQRNRLRCVRCVNENRKQRKHLIGCFDDWLFRSTIHIGWRLRALRLDGNRVLRNVFDCVIFLRLLCTFRFPAKRNRLRCVRCVKLETGLHAVRVWSESEFLRQTQPTQYSGQASIKSHRGARMCTIRR